MSKSTPLSNLPNLKKHNQPAFEQRENDIVKEILNEIDSDKAPPPQPESQGPTPEQIQMQQMMQQQQEQAMIQQQMYEQQLMEQQMREQQMQEQMMNNQMPNTDNIVQTAELNEVSNASFHLQLLDTLKPSLLVGVIVAILSVPVLSAVIERAVNSKEAFKRFALPMTLFIKALLGGGMFYGGSNVLEL
jgi:hypothetical protein